MSVVKENTTADAGGSGVAMETASSTDGESLVFTIRAPRAGAFSNVSFPVC